jgi:hypothetical protein
MTAYQQECLRRWQQDGTVDQATAVTLGSRPLKSRLIWWSGLLPSSLGRLSSRLIGNVAFRSRCWELLGDGQLRRDHWRASRQRSHTRLIRHGRIADTAAAFSPFSHLVHRILQAITPRAVHRFLVDPAYRRAMATSLLLLLFSPRYQSWFGGRRINAAIERWSQAARIDAEEAAALQTDLRGREVLAYTRGFGMHLALKALAPIVLPAKVGGVAAVLAGGSLWFLLPMILTPVMRTAVTLANAWTTRREGVSHGEALVMGLLPVVGSIAYPMQMFSTRPRLSTFLIRDAASRLGRRLPIYGGADSRTELAMIRATDFLIELMEAISTRLQARLRRAELPVHHDADVLRTLPRTRLGRWIDRKASERIRFLEHHERHEQAERESGTPIRAAA